MGHGLREAVGHGLRSSARRRCDLQGARERPARGGSRLREAVGHGCDPQIDEASSRSPRSTKPRREAHCAAQPPRREAHREAQWPDRRSPVRERERAETESRVETWEGEARVFWKMVYGKIFRKPFSLFYAVIFRSISVNFPLTSVLQCPKRSKMLKTFSVKRFTSIQTEPK